MKKINEEPYICPKCGDKGFIHPDEIDTIENGEEITQCYKCDTCGEVVGIAVYTFSHGVVFEEGD